MTFHSQQLQVTRQELTVLSEAPRHAAVCQSSALTRSCTEQTPTSQLQQTDARLLPATAATLPHVRRASEGPS